jgi:tripartite-type tricarboxylate transporter receptor subunit TctC
MRGKRRILFTAVLLVIFAAGLSPETVRAAYPEKVINFVVPWPAGGRTDVASRIFAPVLEKQLGKPVIVINKTGAGGVVGSKEVAMAKPDGYTIMMTSISMILTQYTVPTPTNLKDYVPVCQLLTSPALLVVHAKSPWKTLKEFVDYAKANPGKVKNGASGTGTSDHIFSAAFQKAAGIKLTHVPYAGDAPAVTAVAGRHVDSNFAPMASVKSFVDAGELRVLGVGADQRRPLYVGIPTWKEQGVNLSISAFQGIFAPKGTPAHIVSILEKNLEKVVKDPDVAGKIEKIGIELEFISHENFIKTVDETDKMLQVLVEQLGLKVTPK